MEAANLPILQSESGQDFRVKLKSKKIVVDQLTKYKHSLKKLLDSQSQISEDDKEKLLATFEQTVQENVLISGLSWEEAPDDEGNDDECSALDDVLDEKIVQTSAKRRFYPKKILPYVVRALKAERKLMDFYVSMVNPEDMKKDPVQADLMKNVSEAAPGMLSQARTVSKSLRSLQQSAEGLYQALNMELSAESLEVYREVFGCSVQDSSPALLSAAPGLRQTVRRAVVEAEYSDDYIPPRKRTAMPSETDQ
ncbi:kinetochore-associated protein NSL1 homolog [Chanos chanos]|uniref:Kinetochore-associated protein NSL1 homolog n=1 Tax=Chanos chanos TaxID=29144 RepID=A0A6J2V530_CHACN|nr:kinetochore-associated protein NSL1 homolog [Chanos chanos]